MILKVVPDYDVRVLPLHHDLSVTLVHRVFCVLDGATPTTTPTASDIGGVQANRINPVNRISMLEKLGVTAPSRMVLLHQMAQVASRTHLISLLLSN